MEAVDIPETFDICQSIIRAGGHIANLGAHGKSVEFRAVVESGDVEPEDLVTHRRMTAWKQKRRQASLLAAL